MKIKEVIGYLEQIAPLEYQENYDNSGLIVGNKWDDVTNVLVCLDAIPEVIDEAVSKKCNLVIAHHPIIFKGLKRIDPSHYIGKSIIKAIRNGIAIYAIHTNLDNVLTNGVNHRIADQLGLTDIRILSPKSSMETFSVRLSMGDTRPMIEKINPICKEVAIESSGIGEITFRGMYHRHLRQQIKSTISQYATLLGPFKVFPLSQPQEEVGSGITGDLNPPVSASAMISFLKDKLKLKIIRHTPILHEEVNKIAICGGSGSFLLSKAIQAKAQVFISADFKYHDFFEANDQICIMDIGHYESEKYTIDLIQQLISRKFTTFAAYCTTVDTNPINYS